MTPEELSLAQHQLGPWLAGSLLDVLFQGILFCQFSRYIAWYREDKLVLKLLVLGLTLLTSLKSIQSFALTWILFIKHFTDLQTAILLNYTAWWQTGNPLMVALIGVYVQLFFCHSLYRISRRWWIVVPLAVVFAFAFASACAATYFISRGADAAFNIELWLTIHFGSVFAGDAVLTLLMSYFLIKNTEEARFRNVGILGSVWRLTFLTSAPATICAMFNLIFSQIWSSDKRLISIAFNLALPKLYAISMMWSLNSRPRSGEPAQDPIFSSEFDSDGLRQVRRRAGNNIRTQGNAMELGAIKSVQIRTRTETTQQIDVSDMFNRSTKDDMKGRKSGDARVRYVDSF